MEQIIMILYTIRMKTKRNIPEPLKNVHIDAIFNSDPSYAQEKSAFSRDQTRGKEEDLNLD